MEEEVKVRKEEQVKERLFSKRRKEIKDEGRQRKWEMKERQSEGR